MEEKILKEMLFNFVLITREDVEIKTESGFELSSTTKGKKTATGIVEVVGNGVWLQSGKFIKTSVKKGDRVQFYTSSQHISETTVNKIKYLVMPESNIFARL